MIDKVPATLIAGLCLVVPVLPVWADEGTRSEEGRYTFSKIADGFIGSTCRRARCRPAASGPSLGPSGSARGPRSAENEIGLRAENALLRDLISRGCPCQPGRCPSRPACAMAAGCTEEALISTA